jgi:hypothetical protein
MQGSPMLHTPSPSSDRLPFHPKYLNGKGHEVMSPGEFRTWLHNDPHAPPLYRSEPTSAESTRPISLSAPDSPIAPIHCQLTADGQYQTVTCQVTLEVMPASSRGRSPCSPFGALMPFTPIFTQVLLSGSEPTAGTSGGASPEDYYPSDATSPGEHHKPPYQPVAGPSGVPRTLSPDTDS